MVGRVQSKDVAEAEANVFADEKLNLDFISSGCRVLDCALSGGWPLGRISNIVGDRSTGKTLLAIESCANFAKRYPKGRIYYREVESAFDKDYAVALGLPASRVDFGDEQINTVEELFKDLSKRTKFHIEKDIPALYIIDSFDALTTEIDLDRNFGEQTYRTDKPTMMGELFRKQCRPLERAQMHLQVISQVRDKIGVMFGKKYSRSGGRALDFYASHVVYLAFMQTYVKTIGKTKRATGVRVKAKCEKNKVGLPFRDCEFVLRFGFGVDDLTASVEWLESVNKLGALTKKHPDDFIDSFDGLSDKDYEEAVRQVGDVAEFVWRGIDRGILPTRKKYPK